jgi:hypothetical protein
MGADIASACGQLVVQKEQEAKSAELLDIEDAGLSNDKKVKVNQRPTGAVKKTKKRSVHILSSKLIVRDEDELSRLVVPLTVATSVAATCFVISTVLFVRQQRR